MSSASNDQGRAYEFAWINTLYDRLSVIRSVRIVHNSSYEANESAWQKMSTFTQQLYITSAEAAVDAVLELEPRMTEIDNQELTLQFQQDGAGITGDVRDVVVKRDNIEWEIGLSIKHNHEAVKHSRLSHKLDFGREWFKIPCSQAYWNAIAPIFDRLTLEKYRGLEWSETDCKDQTIYIPLLQAFMDEVNRAYNIDDTVPRKMVEYLIGIKDYYKIVSKDGNRMTLIHTFNMHDTLNKPSRVKISAITVPVVQLPTRIVAFDFKRGSSNTVEMYLDNGWELSFRIHNASKLVEPSLKFDVQFMGMPPTIVTISCSWR